MSVEIEKIFSAEPMSTSAFLIKPGQGCYIPAYQRHYSWDRSHIRRLFEDLSHGLNLLLNRSSSINYMGTVISIHDTKHKTVKPVDKQQVPSKVMTIVDGQQRLSTIILLNIALHSKLKELIDKLKGEDDLTFWLMEEAEKTAVLLKKTYLLDQELGNAPYRYYPKLIRAYMDVWSRKPSQASYTSPIGKLIWDYIKFSSGSAEGTFTLPSEYGAKAEESPYRKVGDVFRFMQDQINKSLKFHEKRIISFPLSSEIAESASFLNSLFDSHSAELQDYIENLEEDNQTNDFINVLYLVALSKFVNERLALTNVVTDDEDDAFDMFEALNTTGTPLTAFETFKPKVIEMEGIEDFESTTSNQFLSSIENYFNGFSSADSKQKATTELLAAFASYFSGDKLASKLTDQRRYLRQSFADMQGLEDRRRFVKNLYEVATFIEDVWNGADKGNASFSSMDKLDSETLVCLSALSQMKHSVVIAPLTTFFAKVLENEGDPESAKTRFERAIRKTTAFTMLWRGAKGGTAGIDNKYRDLMKKGSEEVGLPPMCVKTANQDPDFNPIIGYQEGLQHLLSVENYDDVSHWIGHASKTPIYKANRTVARLFLFLYGAISTPDEAISYLSVYQDKPSANSLINLENWLQDEYYSIEHIAPKSGQNSWDNQLYDEDETIHRLGNLLLLPQQENTILSNRDWTAKRVFYKMLGAKTSQEFDSALSSLREIDVEISLKSEDIFRLGAFFEQCMIISKYQGAFNLDLVDTRSSRIAEVVQKKFNQWLTC